MYGGGKKTQWEDDGVMAETFEKAPHGYQMGRRRGLSLTDTDGFILSLGGLGAAGPTEPIGSLKD